MLLSGCTQAKITEGLAKEGYDDDPTILIAAAYAEIANRHELVDDRMAFHLEARRHLLLEAITQCKIDQARMILADLAKLEGLYPAPGEQPETDNPIKTDSAFADVQTIDEAYPN
jgi:hypothetical protein